MDVVERTVRVLHRLHDELVDLAGRLGEAEARAQSYCDEWSIAQVFSHLGSGAEIGREELSAALAGEDPPASTHPDSCLGPPRLQPAAAS